MRMVILLGKIYMTNDDGWYTPVTFAAVPGGVVMSSGEPMTWDQVVAAMIATLLEEDFDTTDLNGIRLLKQWNEERRDE